MRKEVSQKSEGATGAKEEIRDNRAKKDKMIKETKRWRSREPKTKSLQ